MFLARCAQSANFLTTRLHRFKLRARPNVAFLCGSIPTAPWRPTPRTGRSRDRGGRRQGSSGSTAGKTETQNRLFDSCGRSNAVCKSLHSLDVDTCVFGGHPRNNAPSLAPIDRDAAAIVNPRNAMAQTPSAAARYRPSPSILDSS
jgi:hypothetical protein